MAKTVSSPFRVQIKAPGVSPKVSASGSIDDLAYEGIVTLNVWIDPQTGLRGASSAAGKHANHQFCPVDNKFYTHGGDGDYPGAEQQSGAVHSFRYTLNAQKNNLTFDLYYPYWGKAGKKFPGGAGCNPWVWDNSRGCFWTLGGFYEGIGWTQKSPRLVGIPQGGFTLYRFWVTGAQAGEWEVVNDNIPSAHGEGQSMIYHPPSDCLIWCRDEDSRLYWYNCTTGATGNVQSSLTFGLAQHEPNVWDSVKNEMICQSIHGGSSNGIYAISLANFPTSCTARRLWTGYTAGGIGSGYAQHPCFIRGRKFYTFGIPHGASSDEQGRPAGNGLGFYELDLETLEMKQASQPSFDLLRTNDTGALIQMYALNEGAYSPTSDVLMASRRTEPAAAQEQVILKWTPPTWAPGSGEVKAITRDYRGAAPNTPPYPPRGVYSGIGNPLGWVSFAYCRDLSTNGCLVYSNGGDQDYWGNEVYAFDLDTRRWFRLSNPSTAMTGNTAADIASPSSSPTHFNALDCEHGPEVAEYGWGLLPAVGGVQPTTPATCHNYDSVVYVPGRLMGNLRGAYVRPISKITYRFQSTGRAHYFDLDLKRWGRFSTNRASIAGDWVPVTALDENHANGPRIYHNSGYLDLTTHAHVPVAWGGSGVAFDTGTEFDPVRRLWLQPGMFDGNPVGVDDGRPGTLAAIPVDTSTIGVPIRLTGTLWTLFKARQGGIVYFPPLDCFFFYNKTRGFDVATIYKIQPPVSRVMTPSELATMPWTVTRIALPGVTQPASPPAPGQGTYKLIRYVPPLKCLAFWNCGNNIYLFRPSGF